MPETGKPLRGKYSPVEPVAYGAPVACPGETDGEVLSAVTGTNADLIEQAARLWIVPGDRIADITLGNGHFWGRLPDLAVAGTDLATGTDCRALPYEDKSFDVVAFDPPYQPMHGSPSRSFGVGNSYRSGATGLQTITDVLGLYEDGLAECARILKPGGRVLVKCQDMTYNHRLHLVTLDVLRLMASAGMDLADQFILVNRSRMPKAVKRQQRARRAHSVLWVGVLSLRVRGNAQAKSPEITKAACSAVPGGREAVPEVRPG